ncbi:MAG: hypothetical protein Q8L00_10935, partial [Deltaproteobacteria bacterium]|nr:hypothetical protein [Deltaproteobacteria bacterium]
DKVRLVKPTPRTNKRYPSLKIGDEGTVVRITSDYNVITDEDRPFYGIDWGKPITDGSELKDRNDPNPRCQPGHGSYIEPGEIINIINK